MSLNNPNPLRTTVCAPSCQASAVLGCRIAAGVAAKIPAWLCPNDLIERLIYIMGNGIERAGETRYGMVRIRRIGVVGIADTKSPGQVVRQFPGVLRIKVQIQEIVRLRIGQRISRRGGRRYTVDELRQGRIPD